MPQPRPVFFFSLFFCLCFGETETEIEIPGRRDPCLGRDEELHGAQPQGGADVAVRRRRALLSADDGPGLWQRGRDGVCAGVEGGGLRGSVGEGEEERRAQEEAWGRVV